MEETFKQLQKDGKNCVDNLIQWMKESKLVNETKEAEEKARSLFSEVADQQNVELKKFKEIVARVAEETHQSAQQLAAALEAGAHRLQASAAAAAAALRDTLAGK